MDVRTFAIQVESAMQSKGYQTRLEFDVEPDRLGIPNVRVWYYYPGETLSGKERWSHTDLVEAGTPWRSNTAAGIANQRDEMYGKKTPSGTTPKKSPASTAPASSPVIRVVQPATSPGVVQTTAPVVQTIATPSSGTLTAATGGSATGAATLEGVAGSIQNAMIALGYDPSATYNGYEWAHFFSRSSAYDGSTIGPSELGMLEGERISLTVFAARFNAWKVFAAGQPAGIGTPSGAQGGPETGSQVQDAGPGSPTSEPGLYALLRMLYELLGKILSGKG